MPKNFAGKTYEVFVGEGKRWIIDSTHATRSAALEVAEELLHAVAPEGGISKTYDSRGDLNIKADLDGKRPLKTSA